MQKCFLKDSLFDIVIQDIHEIFLEGWDVDQLIIN